jgi:integrase
VLPAGVEGDFEGPVSWFLSSMESPETYRTVVSGIKTLQGLMGVPNGWLLADRHDVLWLRDRLREWYSVGHANKLLGYWRGVLGEYLRAGAISHAHYLRLTKGIKVRGRGPKAGRALVGDEFRTLRQHCRQDPRVASLRDDAILCLMAMCGLRVSEVAALRVKDVAFAYPMENSVVRARGKGNKVRYVPMPEAAYWALHFWVDDDADGDDPVFDYDARGIRRVIESRRRAAGVAKFTTHDLRRTYITNLLSLGIDLATVQRLAGHVDPKTTTVYDRRPESEMRAAVQRLGSEGPV